MAISVLVVSYLLTFVVRYGTAVVLDDLRADLRVGEVALGALAAAYFWPYALMQPVAGILADRLGAKPVVSTFLTVAAGGTVLFAVAPSFPVALVGRVLGGAGVGVVYICSISLIARWVSAERFGTAAGLFSASGILGGFLAARPLDALVGQVGWRAAFGIVALLLLGAAVLAAVVIPPAPHRDGADGFAPLRGLGEAVRLRNLWLVGVYAFVVLGILSAMQGLWTIPFLTDVYDLDEGSAAAVLEALSIGLLLAVPFWGVVADRVLRSQRSTILVSLAFHTSIWALLAIDPEAWPRHLLYVLFLLVGFSNGCWMPAYALVRATSPDAIQGTALGLLNFAFFAGAAFIQQGSGVLLAPFAQGGGGSLSTVAYRNLFTGFVVALVIAAICVAASREDEPEHRSSGQPRPSDGTAT